MLQEVRSGLRQETSLGNIGCISNSSQICVLNGPGLDHTPHQPEVYIVIVALQVLNIFPFEFNFGFSPLFPLVST